MKILVLEDRGSVSYDIGVLLKDVGHAVHGATTVGEAQEYWKESRGHGGLDCIIADLNMRTVGLTEEEKEMTKGGILTGWVWLERYVFSVDVTMKERTIVYSAYPADFTAQVSENDRRGVVLIDKLDGSNTLEGLLDAVQRVVERTGDTNER